MSNPTTPFSWQMPTATDLVTDLPADFEVFGQAVATSMADLLGGTSGQILAKNSNTDMDFIWIANDQGDITGVTATSPLTGGGTSGAISIGIQDATTSVKGSVQLSDSTSTTSSVLASTPTATKAAYDLADAAIAKSTVTTAGDIIYRNATVPVRLGIGTANQVLAVNSGATAPEWQTLATIPTIKSVRKSSDQTVTSSTTLVNDSQLKFAVAANETYIFQAWLYTFAADGTPDIKVTFTGPSGSTLFWSSSQVIFNAAASTTLTVVAPGATTADLFVDANLRAIQLYGTIANGATAGDLQFQFAQNTSSANGTSVKAGSSIFGIKV
jgi:hypothetical protein